MFRADSDVELSGGQAVLTARGRAKFGVVRIVLSVVFFGAVLVTLSSLAVAMNFPAMLGRAALSQARNRAEADAEARVFAAQARKRIALNLARVIDQEAGPQEEKMPRLRNIVRILGQQNLILTEAQKSIEIEGDFEADTYLVDPTTGRKILVNGTQDRRINPEAIQVFLKNDTDLAALMQAVNEEALSHSKPDAAAKVREDLARLEKEKP